MSLATARNATRIWIVNVGDLKPYEMETEFFITYGWDTSIWNYDNLDTFVTQWAQREFSLSSADAEIVAGVIANVTRFNSNCKPELLNATTFSLTNYRESVARCHIAAMLIPYGQGPEHARYVGSDERIRDRHPSQAAREHAPCLFRTRLPPRAGQLYPR